MGYTHYMRPMERPLTRKEVNVIKEIIVTSDVEIVGGSGKDGTKAKVNSKSICLNGLNEDSHETFTVHMNDGEFCKTNRKPYDVVVVAILVYLRSIGVVEWTSDGEHSDHLDGIALAQSVGGELCV